MTVYLRQWRNKKGAKCGEWYWKFDLNGATYHKRATNPLNKRQKAQNKREAENFEALARTRLLAGLPIFEEDETEPESPTFRLFVERTYLPWAMFNKRSYQSDKWRSRVLIREFGDLQLGEITSFRIEAFKKAQREGKTQRGAQRAPASVNRLLELLSRILQMAIDNDLITQNPCRKIKKLRLDNRRYRILAADEQVKLLAVCTGRREHLYYLVVLALNTGMRRGELLHLTAEDIDLGRETITVRNTKTNRDRIIPINHDAGRVIHELLILRPQGRLFEMEDISRAWESACREAGIVNLHFHDLRHTFATRLADEGAHVRTIADLLGHTTTVMTSRYTHATDKANREAVVKLNRRKIVAMADTNSNEKVS